jgi:hypothetical protein
MLAGRRAHHRRSPLSLRPLAAKDEAPPAWARAEVGGGYQAGRAAYTWDAWWVPMGLYRLRFSDEDMRLLGLELRDVVPARVEHLREAEGEDPVASGYRFLDAAQALFGTATTAQGTDPAHQPTARTGTCPVRKEQ